MKKAEEYAAVCLIGAAGYGGLETAFRGWTHWSMLAAGGVCFAAVYHISGTKLKSWKKWIVGAAFITAVELLSGILVNIILDWRVWDYSHRFMNLWGQICPLFSLLWLLLCIPATALCPALRRSLRRIGGRASA